MTPYHADPWLTVYAGDCRAAMAAMAPESVHCVVTSPPYWGLRDYGTGTWEGGEDGCDHAKDRSLGIASSGLEGSKATTNHQHEASYREVCGKCGARRLDRQLGLEPTPEEYVADMVVVFREVRRVLRSDGTVWLNLGDSYAGTNAQGRAGSKVSGLRAAEYPTVYGKHGGDLDRNYLDGPRADFGSLKPKDLVGIPWRVAFALQADGWYLRSDIIWAKPNPMPESVTDRPTKAHEYLFLLTKSARYYYDADAVREHATAAPQRRLTPVSAQPSAAARLAQGGHNPTSQGGTGTIRNLRSVWTVATEPYPGAHFATFPQKLVEPCIKAGTSERGVCPECGAPWVRETSKGVLAGRDPEAAAWIEKTGVSLDELRRLGKSGAMRFDEYRMHGATRLVGGDFDPVLAQRLYDILHGWLGRCVAEACGTETTGWRPSCRHLACLDCGHGDHDPGSCDDCRCELHYDEGAKGTGPLEPVPAVVLDPFAGSGTVGRVAQRLSRRAVLIDLNPDYLLQAMGRNRDIPLGLVG